MARLDSKDSSQVESVNFDQLKNKLTFPFELLFIEQIEIKLDIYCFS